VELAKGLIGYGLKEVVIAIAIGLLILIAVVGMFYNFLGNWL